MKPNITELSEKLQELYNHFVKHKNQATWKRWLIQESTRKIAAISGLPAFETGKTSGIRNADMKDVIVLYNFSGVLYTLLQDGISGKKELTRKKLQEIFGLLHNPVWQALYFTENQMQFDEFLRKTDIQDTSHYQISAAEVDKSLEDACQNFNQGIISKKAAEKLSFCVEFYRQMEMIKPFASGNHVMNVFLLYRNLFASGMFPVPFPARAEQSFPDKLNRYLMEKKVAGEMIVSELLESAGQSLRFREVLTAKPVSAEDRLSTLKRSVDYTPGKTNMPDIGLIRRAYRNTIYLLVSLLFEKLNKVHDFFETFELNCTGMAIGENVDRSRVIDELRTFLKDQPSRYFNINFHWRNLRQGGSQAFGFFISLQIEKGPEGYHFNRHDGSLTSYSLSWDEDLPEENIQHIAEEMMGQVIGYIERQK
jgi:hypothetical protein